MKIKPINEIQTLAEAYKKAGDTLYAVGGYVRDHLIGLPSHDVDITGALSYDQMKTICEAEGISYVPMSTRLGTIHIKINNEIYEYTPFRTDVYEEGGAHCPVAVKFGVGMEEDARRRDFTVNALYADVLTGEVVDPLNGLKDLEKKELVLCAEDTLEADALRILRMIRFQGQLGFSISDYAREQAIKNIDLLKDIVPERRWEEFSRILVCDTKYQKYEPKQDEYGIPLLPETESTRLYECLKSMEEIGVFYYLVPELMDGQGLDQNPKYHKYTVLDHMLHSCACAIPTVEDRLTGLLHDVGKPICREKDGNNYKHMVYGVEIAEKRLTELRVSNRIKRQAIFGIRHHMFDIQGTAKEKTIRKAFADWGPEGIEEIIHIREADYRGSGTAPGYVAKNWRSLLDVMKKDGTPFRITDLDIDGNELIQRLSLEEEKEKVGKIMYLLRDHCILFPKDNKREQLVILAKRLVNQNGTY